MRTCQPDVAHVARKTITNGREPQILFVSSIFNNPIQPTLIQYYNTKDFLILVFLWFWLEEENPFVTSLLHDIHIV